MNRTSLIVLRVVLVVLGALIVFTGINRAFGGILTLGWQGSNTFATIADAGTWAIQDNHTRFLGGVWTAIGLLMILAPLRLQQAAPALLFAFAATFIGGLARFTSGQVGLVFGGDIILSLVIELVLMPVLFVWVLRAFPFGARP